MKYILFFIITLCCLSSNAQTVSYTYKPLAAEGCRMQYSVAKQDTSYYIIATVSSDRMRFLKEPQMRIRTFNNIVLSLGGTTLDNRDETAGVIVGNIVIPVTEIHSSAQFPITPSQFEELKNGISKIRLDMTPMNHERTFDKDKIGKKIYKFYLQAKSKDDNF